MAEPTPPQDINPLSQEIVTHISANPSSANLVDVPTNENADNPLVQDLIRFGFTQQGTSGLFEKGNNYFYVNPINGSTEILRQDQKIGKKIVSIRVGHMKKYSPSDQDRECLEYVTEDKEGRKEIWGFADRSNTPDFAPTLNEQLEAGQFSELSPGIFHRLIEGRNVIVKVGENNDINILNSKEIDLPESVKGKEFKAVGVQEVIYPPLREGDKGFTKYNLVYQTLDGTVQFTVDDRHMVRDVSVNQEITPETVGISFDFMQIPENYQEIVDALPKEGGDLRTGRLNSTEAIRKTTTINGIPLLRIEAEMRDGFLGKDESLLEVLALDNDFVISQRLSHLALSRLLRYAEIAHDKFNAREFELFGKKFGISSQTWMGNQDSPFLDGSKTSVDYRLTNIDTGQEIRFSGLHSTMIGLYGFYEGHGGYRVGPEKIIEVFDFLKNRDIGPAITPPGN